MSVDPGLQAEGYQGGSTPVFLQETSLVGSAHSSCPLNLSQIVHSGNGGADSSARNDSGVSSHVHQVFKSSIPPASFPAGDVSSKTKMLHFRSSTQIIKKKIICLWPFITLNIGARGLRCGCLGGVLKWLKSLLL